MAFCEQCGNQLKETTKFCGKCGTPVVAGQAEVQQAPGGGETPAQKAFNAGMACIEAEQYDKAIANFTEAIGQDPEHIDAYYRRGLVYYMQQDYDKAVADFTQAIWINPEIAEVYSIRGDAYACKDNNDKAITDYTKAIQLAPDVAETYGSRAMAYMEKGDIAKAHTDVERGLQIDPENETVVEVAEQLKEMGAQGGGMSGPSSCSQCGTAIEAGEAFCSNCGAKVGAGGGGQYMPAASSCGQCGAPLEAGEAFCANCGAKVGTVVGTAQAVPEPLKTVIQSAPLAVSGSQIKRSGLNTKTEVTVNVEGHFIQITHNEWTASIKLLIDGVLIAQAVTSTDERGDYPKLREKYQFKSGEATIDIYIKGGSFTIKWKIKICINGTHIAGDVF